MPPTPSTPLVEARPQPLPVEPPAPAARPERFEVRDKGNVNLGHIDQPRLSVVVPGSGSVTAEGRVDTLEVSAIAAGNVRFGGLTARHVVVNVAGSGNVTVAPTIDVKINIVGSGKVRLTTRPAQIERNVVGSGRIIDAQ